MMQAKSLLKKIGLKAARPVAFMLMVLIPMGVLNAQQPTHYPSQGDPVRLTFVNILVYFVFPVVLVLLFLFWRRWSRNKKREEEQEEATRN